MDEVLSWPQRLPFSSPFIVFAATLALSLLSAPALMIADRRRAQGTMSLVDRWKLFSWLHPFWAAVLKWMTLAAIAILIAWPLGSALWRSSWPAAIHDAVSGFVRRFSKTS